VDVGVGSRFHGSGLQHRHEAQWRWQHSAVGLPTVTVLYSTALYNTVLYLLVSVLCTVIIIIIELYKIL
jgi:hypothetical protein